MVFSLFRVKNIPIYTASNVNLAWIMQDYLQANGIDAIIEVASCERDDCKTLPSYSVLVSGKKADVAKNLAEQCEAVKIAGFLAPQE